MCLQVKKNNSVFFKHIFYALCIALFFTYALPANAQNRSEAGTIKTKKATRVFYGQASFYANKFNGRKTASGEIFSQKKMTCACNVLPLGTWIKVTNMVNGRSVIVKINDRIHPKMKRITDLSRVGAERLGYILSGLTRVKVEVIGKKLLSR